MVAFRRVPESDLSLFFLLSLFLFTVIISRRIKSCAVVHASVKCDGFARQLRPLFDIQMHCSSVINQSQECDQ